MIVYNNENELNEELITKLVELSRKDKSELNMYFDYYRNNQLIDSRTLVDTSAPNNKIKINYCRKVCDFMTSYLVGVPIIMDGASNKLQEILSYTNFNSVLNDIVLDMNICGYGIGNLYIDKEANVRFARINPLDTIIVMDNDIEKNMRFAITVYENTDILTGKITYTITVYENDNIKTYTMTDAEKQLKKVEETENYFNAIPFCLFMNKDLLSTMEPIISMQNALNKIVSDEVNEFEGMVNSFLVLPGYAGTNEDDVNRMKINRVLLTGDNESKPYWLTKDDTGSHTKDMKKFFIDEIHEIGRLPDIKETSVGASGTALKYKLIDTEILASKQELSVSNGVEEMLYIIFKYLDLLGENEGSYTDIKLKFTRNFIIDEHESTASNDNEE